MDSKNFDKIDPGMIRPSMTGSDWHTRLCYGCGVDNEYGLKADFRFHEESGEVRFEYSPLSFELGAPGYVHGGVLATIMDEAQGVLCFHAGHIVMTDQLHMKYHRATPLDKPFQVRCWLTAARKRRIYTRATIHGSDGELLVSSRATWYAMPERLIRRIFHGPDSGREEDFHRIRLMVEANRKRAREIRKRLRKQKR